MLGRCARRAVPLAAVRSFAADATGLALNFSSPSGTICKKEVEQVIVPGAMGEFGVTKQHSPIVAEMKPGVLKVLDGGSDESYFVSGGFAMAHDDSSCDISAAEAVKLEDFDEAAVRAAVTRATSAAAAKPSDQPQYLPHSRPHPGTDPTGERKKPTN